MSKSSVKIILLHNFQKKGNIGDIISVKPGYAKNFLIPNKFAIYANKSNRNKLEALKILAMETANKMRADALVIAEEIKKINITIVRNSAQDNKIFGTISSKDIVDELSKNSISIERNQVTIRNSIKYLGIHTVKISLYSDVVIEKEINVVNSSGSINVIRAEDESDQDINQEIIPEEISEDDIEE